MLAVKHLKYSESLHSQTINTMPWPSIHTGHPEVQKEQEDSSAFYLNKFTASLILPIQNPVSVCSTWPLLQSMIGVTTSVIRINCTVDRGTKQTYYTITLLFSCLYKEEKKSFGFLCFVFNDNLTDISSWAIITLNNNKNAFWNIWVILGIWFNKDWTPLGKIPHLKGNRIFHKARQ